MTEDDTKRLVVKRALEWNHKVSGGEWFDLPALAEDTWDEEDNIDSLIQNRPDAAEGHG